MAQALSGEEFERMQVRCLGGNKNKKGAGVVYSQPRDDDGDELLSFGGRGFILYVGRQGW